MTTPTTTNRQDPPIATPEMRRALIESCGLGYDTLGDAPGALDSMLQIICGELLAMRHEIRTERIAVVHPDDGREVIFTDVSSAGVVLTVAWLPEGDETRSKVVVDSADDASNVYVGACDEIVGMLSVAVDDDDHKRSIDGSLYLQGYELHKPQGSVLPAISTSKQLQIDVNRGVTLHRDHNLIATAHFAAEFGR